jgi:hypothetical protein
MISAGWKAVFDLATASSILIFNGSFLLFSLQRMQLLVTANI